MATPRHTGDCERDAWAGDCPCSAQALVARAQRCVAYLPEGVRLSEATLAQILLAVAAGKRDGVL